MKIKKYLEQSPIFAINTAYNTIIPKVNRRLNKENINLLQGLVLTAILFEENGEVVPSRLAEIFQSTRGNISHVISDLEYKGFVKRIVSSQDARSFKIELKADGKRKALLLIKFFDQIQEIFEKELGVQNCQKTVNGIHSLIAAASNNEK
ncbi:MAG: hypothetical protein A4S09_07100 [Proteobacteria bacterium SG_bin7]|nr:MAG: hypothetical protein A4S09_07100 [Proteobacteria bacterium SG_bin7]